MSSFGFGFGQTPNSFNPPKPFSETKTGFGWSPFGNTTPPSGATTIPALATNNATSATASSRAFDFTPVFGAPVFNTASAPASGTNCTITLATTGSPVFGTTSTPTIGTTVTITPGVGTSSAPTGGTNAIAITINVGTASTSSVGNGITIAPSVGSTVTIAPASGTSITLMQAAGTTITITSNPTSGVTSTPGIGAASTPTVCFPTSTAPASTRGGFGFPTSTAPASTQGGFGFPTFTSPTSTQGGFGFPASTAPASTQGGFGFPTYTTPASTSTFSSSKVGASSQFGTQSSPFGAQPTPIVGNNASRQSASGSHQGHGSRVVPYTASIDADSFSAASPIKIHSISAMPIHKHKCHEELRWEDYQLGDRGGAIPPGGSSKHTTQSFVQKEKRASFCPFGCPFAQTSSSTFNTSTSSPCAERSTSLFAQPSSNPFGPRPSPSPFGAQPSSSTFGAKPSSSTFGPPPSSSSFGAQPSSSIFGLPPSSSPFGAIFGNSTFAPSSFGQTSSPNPSWFMPSQVSEPVETSTSPFHSNLTNTASSSPAFGQQSSAFGAFSTPAFGGSSTQRSPFGGASGTSVLGQKPACGIFWPSPAQTNLLGRTAQPLQPAFGSNMFGTTSPFGESKPAFGLNTTPAFGSTNISAFGSSASPFGGTSIPAFGAPSTPTFSSTPSPAFGSTGSAFGTTSSNLFETGGSFGVTSAAFGQSRSAFGATTSAPAWCQSSPSFGFSSSAPAFGQSSSSSGAQSTTPTLGNTALGQSPYGGQQGGSRETYYTGTAEPDSNGMAILESISAMTAYKEKIHEELRWEDYQLGDKGGPSPAGGDGFGMSTVQTNPLNPTPATPFAQMSSSPFNASTSSSLFAPKTSTSPTSFSFSTLATSSTPSFNFPTPSNPQTQSAQTGTTSFQMNPSTLGSNLFNNTSSLQSSSLGTTSNQLGNNPPAETDSSTTITINEPSLSNGGSSQPGFGYTSSSTLGTITINSSSGSRITITPASSTTITITPTLGSTTVTIAPSSGTTSTSTYGHTPFASPFVVPFQASQPSQTSTSIFNTINSFDQIHPGNRGGFGSSLFERSQNNSGPWLGSACPATNPFNLLHRPGQLPFGHAASSPSVQNGISGSLTATRDLIESFRNQSDVALRITKELLLTKGKDKNMVYSPLSIHVVLSLIAAGSTKGHPLHDEMLKFLKSRSIEQLNELASNLVPLVFADGTPSGGPSLSFSNGVWVETSLPVKASFKEVLDNAYKAVLKQVDFRTRPEEARCEVNSWVEKVTRGLIKDLLPHGTVNCTTRIILANALYFKGAWDQKFVESRTNMFDFHLLSGKSVKAPFMTSWKDQFISVFDGFKVLKLPYKQGEDHNRRFSMYMFLPNASNGLPSLVERVCSEAGFLDRYLPCRKVEVDKFLIPKFKITFGIEVVEVLETLGLKLPCLSETVVGAEPFVNLILHKSFIEVNEEGTEAAAATATAAAFGCAAPRPVIEKIDFVADHPFLFLIREEATGAVMFVGHVLDPVAK